MTTESKSAESVTGGFVAGTLVHTERGLVPIEQIRVGDRVLSQAEETGELAYKRVLETFSFDDKEVGLVEYTPDPEFLDYETGHWEHLVATIDHPFFVNDVGWTAANELDPGNKYKVVLRDGSLAQVMYQELRNTDSPNVALAMNQHYWGDHGTLVDLRGNSAEIIGRDKYNAYALSIEGPYFFQCVYNLEIEGYHTYYVGKLGVWVHSSPSVAKSMSRS